jgi:hypothetical protein
LASPLILAGQDLQAGQQQAQLNQYYGYADTAQTTVLATTLTNLSSMYTIPAGEAYAGASYELECSGFGTQASSGGPTLTFAMTTGGGAFGGQPVIGGANFSASQPFRYWLKFKLVCQDGVSAWWCSLAGNVAVSGTNLLPGTGGAQAIAVADANTGVRTQPVSSAISVAIQAKWSSAANGPTVTNTLTTFRKVA